MEVSGCTVQRPNVWAKTVKDHYQHEPTSKEADQTLSSSSTTSPSSEIVEDEALPDAADKYPSILRMCFITPGIMAGVFIVALDNYILATAIPTIAEQFHGLSAVGWYASSYFLTQTAFQPAFGSLFSSSSVKWLFITAIIVFEVGSVISAVATSPITLIVGRLVSGVGGAGIYVGTLTMSIQVVPLARRPFYLSFVLGMFGVASVAGPLLGGIFTDSSTLTWRFCFWINLPIGTIAALLIGLSYKDGSSKTGDKPSLRTQLSKLDIPGLVFMLGACTCFILAIQNGGIRLPWSDSRVWGCLMGFFLLSSAFVVVQVFDRTRTSVPLHIISQRTVAGCCAFILLIYMSVASLVYYLPFYFQAVKGQSARASGIDNLPFLVVMLFAPLISGSMASLSGHYIQFMWLGPVISAVSSGILSTLDSTSSSAKLNISQAFAGLGIGLCTQLPFTAAQAVLPADMVIMASSLISLCNSLGRVFGTNIAQSIFTNVLIRELDGIQGVDSSSILTQGVVGTSKVDNPLVRDAFATALGRSYLVPTACCALAFISAFSIKYVCLQQKKTE